MFHVFQLRIIHLCLEWGGSPTETCCCGRYGVRYYYWPRWRLKRRRRMCEQVRMSLSVKCGWNIHNRIFIFTSYIDTIVFVDCVSVCVCVFVCRLQHSCEWPGVYCRWLVECRSLWLWNGQAVAHQHHQPVWHQFPLHTGTVNCIILYVLHTEHIHFRAHTLAVHI